MGVDLLAIFKTTAKNLIGLKGGELLGGVGIKVTESVLYGSSGPFGLSLSYIEPETNKRTTIPLDNITGGIKAAGNNPIFFGLWLNHGLEYEGIGKISPNLQLLIEKSKIVYKLTKPEFGFCEYDLGFEPYYWHFNDCIMWLNFFGLELVKKYGKNKLLSAPAYKIEELSDGGIFIQASVGPSMLCFPSKEELEKRHFTEEELDLYDADAQIKKIRKHLGFQERSVKPK